MKRHTRQVPLTLHGTGTVSEFGEGARMPVYPPCLATHRVLVSMNCCQPHIVGKHRVREQWPGSMCFLPEGHLS